MGSVDACSAQPVVLENSSIASDEGNDSRKNLTESEGSDLVLASQYCVICFFGLGPVSGLPIVMTGS